MTNSVGASIPEEVMRIMESHRENSEVDSVPTRQRLLPQETEHKFRCLALAVSMNISTKFEKLEELAEKFYEYTTREKS